MILDTYAPLTLPEAPFFIAVFLLFIVAIAIISVIAILKLIAEIDRDNK